MSRKGKEGEVMAGKLHKVIILLVILIIAGLWISSGVYTVGSGENAVLLRFGAHAGTITEPGLHWHIPVPVERVEIVNIEENHRIEFGYKTLSEGGDRARPAYASTPHQSLMITGDDNLVNVETAIQYRITVAEDYLFNVSNPHETLENAAESAIRRVVANHTLDEILTENKFEIQSEIKADLQQICNDYGLGVSILAVQLQDVYPPDQVDAAFKDVANAKEDKTSYINEAESYYNEIVPKARGNAAKMVNDAEAYKEKRIAEARGDVASFIQILERYQMGKEVTRKRLYLETLEEVLPNVDVYIVGSDENLVKFLPLENSDAYSGMVVKTEGGK
jgi:membrane protease subunit HflK